MLDNFRSCLECKPPPGKEGKPRGRGHPWPARRRRRSQPAAAFGQDPTSRHRKRALAPWRNQRVRCVAVGVCCMWFLNYGVFAQVHGGGERANAGLRRGWSMGIPKKEGLHLQCVPLARGFMGTLSRPASFISMPRSCFHAAGYSEAHCG